MKLQILILSFCTFILTGCIHNPTGTVGCQPDYWNDSKSEFAKTNCIGYTGHWVSQSGGKRGYFCTSPECRPDNVNCINPDRCS